MSLNWFTKKKWLVYPAIAAALAPWSAAPVLAQSNQGATTPIQHVIVIIGENRSFDNVFATYKPVNGQTVENLLSKGIVNADGTPGPNFALAAQFRAADTAAQGYLLTPGTKTAFTTLPPENTGGAPSYPNDSHPAPFQTLAVAAANEHGLLKQDLERLITGATGEPNDVVDTRVLNYSALPDGPFQLTPSIGYDDYASSPVHRFYQMWQQLDCGAGQATSANPSGCLADLFPWVEITIGAGSNGKPRPNPFNDETTHEGATSMSFFNVQNGDAPYLNALAHEFALSDNYHQAVMGGTGANHVAIGTGDAVWYSDGKGNPLTPPSNEIENPNPAPGTNNWYAQDGYSGGTYSNCSDSTQPGVGQVLSYLSALPYKPASRCAANTYYLLNNYNPGYFGDGTVNSSGFTIPPSSVRTIGDELLEKKVSWKYYGEGWNLYLTDPNYNNPYNVYCNICNPFAYATSIMTNQAVRTAHLVDVTGPNGLYADLTNGTLPAVSFVKPDGFLDGHPSSSKLDLFEGFVRKVLTTLNSNPQQAASTAVLITVDEGGGYYDSGYVQPVDFFGDGTRIPLIVVSNYSKGGKVVHQYYDHVSILKFIEKNWNLAPVTGRSRDNLPNPVASAGDPYVPSNSPAIGDLMEMFNFSQQP